MKKHRLLGVILLLCLGLGAAYSARVPLGEAPDEPAHLAYVHFIARKGRLPATLDERLGVGYRAVWPPLYQSLAARAMSLVDEAPPTRLKFVGDTPRRLIPTNGQTIAAVVHTADEAWPWRGLPLAWHVGRLVSVVLVMLAVLVTYTIAWRITGRPVIAAAAAAIHAFSPQVLFIGGSLNDDNLLILLSGLLILTLVTYSRTVRQLRLPHVLLLGLLLGLATITKYNVLPLWAVVLTWSGWFAWRRLVEWRTARANTGLRSWIAAVFRLVALPLAVLFTGVALSGGWWFIFAWQNFNQVKSLGWLRGSVAALTAATSDASVLKLVAGGRPITPSLPAWQEWITTLFQSYWGLFGGGSTIHLPAWIYWLLGLACLAALAGGLRWLVSALKAGAWSTPGTLFLLTPLYFLPLPLLRFGLTGGAIAETAQGRHFFPAISTISLALALGLAALGSRRNGAATTSLLPGDNDPSPYIPHPSSIWPLLSLPLLLFFTSLYGLVLIPASYPPLIPLRTTPGAATAGHLLRVKAAEDITLVGYELAGVTDNILPVSLVWQADAVPGQDYLLELTLVTGEGETIGGWLGHPLGGRYPSRAWDKGDVLRHTVPVPLLPGLPPTPATLRLRLLDPSGQPAGANLALAERVTLPAIPARPATPEQLRADELAADAPFTYRSTLSLAWPGRGPTAPALTASDGTVLSPDLALSGSGGSIAQFIVGPAWSSGSYSISGPDPPVQVTVSNRLRQFDPPTMDTSVQANFAGYLTLLGYDLPQRRVQPGESFPVTLHWRAEQTMGQNLKVFNHLLDRAGVQRGGSDRIPQNYYTTLLWVPGEIVSDAYRIQVAADAPPGVYWLDVGLYPADRPALSLPLLVDGRLIDQNSVYLGPVKIGGPPPQVTAAEVQPGHALDVTFGQQIKLLGFDLAGAQPKTAGVSRPAGSKTLTLFWQAWESPAADYTVFVHLLDQQGHLAGQADGPPAAGAYPTSLWDAGEIVIDPHALPDLPPGRYELKVGLYRPDTGERLAAPGSPDGAVRLVELEVE